MNLPLALLLLYLWLNRGGSLVGKAVLALRGPVGIVAANVIVRQMVPQRPRPPMTLYFTAWLSVGNRSDLADFGSFPSDTMTLAAAIVTAVAARSRLLGLAAALWAALISGFARLRSPGLAPTVAADHVSVSRL